MSVSATLRAVTSLAITKTASAIAPSASRVPRSRSPMWGASYRLGTVSAMNYRRLGRTGFEVSEIGYGAWGISGVQWIGAEDDESIAALNRAIDLGLNF